MAQLQIRNPHSILAALQARPQAVSQIVIPHQGKSESDAAWSQVVQTAKANKIPIVQNAPGQSPGKSDRGRGKEEGGRTSVSYALVQERASLSPEEIFKNARDKKGGKGLWLALDSLQDPHNIGAIFRTAAFFGVQGIVLTEERSAPLSGAAYDVAAGGMEAVPFATVVNLQRAFEVAKKMDLWILGTSEHAPGDLKTIEQDRPWLLVLGNEEKGMRRLTEESCDVLCKISPQGSVTSLNVSVAAGIFISYLSA